MTRTETEARRRTIRARLEAGSSCKAIAEELGVSLSVASTVALASGFRSRAGRRKTYDWTAIRNFYESGHTKREFHQVFGFSDGAWRQAVARGDIEPRPQPDPIKHSHATRKEVERRLAGGQTQAQIAADLGLSKGTVAFHVRRLGRPADRRFARRYDWAAIRAAYEGGLTAKACRERFGCSAASWAAAVGRGEIVPRPRKEPHAQVFCIGQKRTRFHLKRRLIETGLKQERCEICGIREWRSQPISLELHHINGDGRDNRLENLQLLCPNCHSQTENFSRHNARRRAA